MRIPRRLHQMWIPPSPSVGLPADIASNVRLWSALNPGYEHRLWSLTDVLALCHEHARSEIAEAIGTCRFPSMQADLGRLLLLELFGGFWSDLKLAHRGKIPPELHSHETVLTQHFAKPGLQDPAALLVNGFIGAAPGAPLIAAALALALCNVRERQGDGAFAITGPGALTTAWLSFRLARPDCALRVHVIPHTVAWGGMWDVSRDSYNLSGQHWAARQLSESPFVGEAPTFSPAPGLFVAVPGHITAINRIVSKQGFHPFEPENRFCWADDSATPRVFFDAFMPFDHLVLKAFAALGTRIEAVGFRVNRAAAAHRSRSDGDGWHTITVGPIDTRPSWNELAIQPAAERRPSASSDPRRLSIALAWLQPLLGAGGPAVQTDTA